MSVTLDSGREALHSRGQAVIHSPSALISCFRLALQNQLYSACLLYSEPLNSRRFPQEDSPSFMQHEWGWVSLFSLVYATRHDTPCWLSISSVVAVLGSEFSSLHCLLPLPWLSPLSLVSFLKCRLLYLEILAWLFEKQALMPPSSPQLLSPLKRLQKPKRTSRLPGENFPSARRELPFCPEINFSCLHSLSQLSLLKPRHQ